MRFKKIIRYFALLGIAFNLVGCGGATSGGSAVAVSSPQNTSEPSAHSSLLSSSQSSQNSASTQSVSFSAQSTSSRVQSEANSSVALAGHVSVTVDQVGDGGYVYQGIFTTLFNTALVLTIYTDEGYTPVISGSCPKGFFVSGSSASYQIHFSNFYSDCDVSVAFKFVGSSSRKSSSQHALFSSSAISKSIYSQSSSRASSTSSSVLVGAANISITQVGLGGVTSPGVYVIAKGAEFSAPLAADKGFVPAVSGCDGYYSSNAYVIKKVINDCVITVEFHAAKQINIPDSALNAAIRTSLGLTSSDLLTDEKMIALQTLFVSENITSLEGLQYAHALMGLTVEIPLEKKTALTFSDLTPISNLRNLNYLVLNQTNVEDISSIGNKSNLLTLRLRNSNVSTIANLGNLTNLRELDLSDTKISNIDVLSGFSELTDLSIGNTNVSSIAAVRSMPKLKVLGLAGSVIDDVTVADLKGIKLQNLSLPNTAVTSLAFLEGDELLKYLYVDNSPITSLEPLLSTGLLSVGSSLNIMRTCLIYSGKSQTRTILNQLRKPEFMINETPADFAYEALDPNGSKLCPQKYLNANINLHADFQTNGDLLLNWNMAVDVANRTFRCEFYFGVYKQQRREPHLLINNCPLAGSKIISLPAFVNEPIRMTVTDDNLLYQDIEVSPTSLLLDPVISAIDWGQTVVTSNPRLVPDREALFRVHVTSANSFPVPELEVTLSLNGQVLTLVPQKPIELPQEKNYLSLDASYRVVIPKEWMKSGLNVSVKLPNQSARIVTPVFTRRTSLNLTMIPMEVFGTTAELFESSKIEKTIESFWPFSEVKTKIHPIFKSAVNSHQNAYKLLSEIEELRVLESAENYYYGMFSNDLYKTAEFAQLSFAGMTYVNGYSAVGYDYKFVNGVIPSGISTLLHELGHDFGLGHIDCLVLPGEPGFSEWFPYDVKTMGSVGISSDFKTLYLPRPTQFGGYADIMSYCSPRFVSDFNYNRVQDFIELNPTKSFNVSVQDMHTRQQKTSESLRSIYISGNISPMNFVTLRRIIPLDQPEKNHPSCGYVLRVTTNTGLQILRNLEVPIVDHAEKMASRFFSVQIPYVEIASIEIMYQDSVIFTQASGVTNKNEKMLPSATKPTITENGKDVCVVWPKTQYGSATLIQRNIQGNVVMFMDDVSGNHCVPTIGLNNGGDWQLVLRNGLSIKEIVVAR